MSELFDTRNAADLQGEGYSLCSDSQDIDAALSHVPARNLKAIGYGRGEISGAIEKIGDAEVLEVWVTAWSRPFDLTANYCRIL